MPPAPRGARIWWGPGLSREESGIVLRDFTADERRGLDRSQALLHGAGSSCILGLGSGRLGEMARLRTDLQIVWIVLFAAIFWGAIWQHEKLVELYPK